VRAPFDWSDMEEPARTAVAHLWPTGAEAPRADSRTDDGAQLTKQAPVARTFSGQPALSKT
jgi:hypothetical protein